MNKIKLLLIASGIFISTNNIFSQSQDLKDYPFLLENNDGWIILTSGEKLFGSVYLGTLPSYITYTDESGSEKKYGVKDITAAMAGEHYFKALKVIGSSIKIGVPQEEFLEVLIDGQLSLYRRYKVYHEIKIGQPNGPLEFSVNDFIKKANEKIVSLNDIKFINFKKGMSKYLLDSPEISQKIAQGEKGYKRFYIKNIIKEYNNWYLNK